MAKAKKEMTAQAQLIQHIGESLIDSLPHGVLMELFAEWRNIIDDWESHHSGEAPTAEQMEWILGVWHSMPPKEYINGLKERAK